MTRMRLSFLVQGLEGGIATLVSSLVPELIDNGFDAQVLYIGTESKCPAAVSLKGVNRAQYRVYGSRRGQAQKALHMIQAAKSLKNDLELYKPDLVICAGIIPAITYGLLMRSVTAPVVLWEHGPQNSYTAFKRSAIRVCSSRFSNCLSPSKSSLEVFREQFPFFTADTCSVLENGVPANHFLGLSSLPSLHDGLTIIMPARMDGVQKDQASLIEACALLTQEGYKLNLTLIGDGPAKAALMLLTEKRGLQDRVAIKAYTSDVAAELNRHNVLCLSSRWEGFGLAAVEGMFAGLVVMASDVTGLRDVVTHGKTGVLFKPNSPVAIAAALREVIANPALYELMAKNGQQNAAERWTVKKMAQHASQLFRSYRSDIHSNAKGHAF